VEPEPYAGEGERGGLEYATKDELFSQSDFVSIHYVLSDRSRGLIGAHELGLMKPTAYLINTSRGPIVDEKALIHALETKSIAGAGLDVFDIEPLPLDHPLRRMDNTIITPHLGYVTQEGYPTHVCQHHREHPDLPRRRSCPSDQP
jgi:D-3-phosphoglycerate dehydrogenase